MKIRQIDGGYIELGLTGKIKEHFDDPKNYALFIVDEWESLPYSKYIKPDSIILDIGANIGLFALHVFPCASRIICVEPTPQHMEIQVELLKKVHAGTTSHLAYRVDHMQAALNSYTGNARFRNEPVNTTMNTLREGTDSYEVHCLTMKDVCLMKGLDIVDFCKIDIEGSEWGALTIERIKEVKGIIKAFFVELHPRTKEAQQEMAARFIEAGYKVEMIDYNGSIYCYEN